MASKTVISSVNVDDIAGGWANGDTLTINDGAIVTVNTDQTKFWKTITINNGKLVISNNSTTTGIRFLMGKSVLQTIANIITPYGLGSMEITGNWIELGVGNGTANQTFNFWGTDFCSCVWVEKTPGSNEYEIWFNITGQPDNAQFYTRSKDYMTLVGKEGAGHFFKQGMMAEPYNLTDKLNNAWTQVLTFGGGTHGAVVPAGCKVRVPNILITDGTEIQSFYSALTYLSYIDMQYSGSLIANCCLFDMFYIAGTQARLLTLTDVGMCLRPTLSKINALTMTRVGLGDSPDRVIFVGGVRTVGTSRFPANAQIWSYINNAVIRDFYKVNTTSTAQFLGNAYAWGEWQYCNGLDVDGYYVYAIGSNFNNPILMFDFVNTSTFKNVKVYGGGFFFQNCTGTTVNGLEWLGSLSGEIMYPSLSSTYIQSIGIDRNGNSFEDGTEYYFFIAQQRDLNQLYPLLGTGYDFYLKPFTPSLTSFPYWFGVLPGPNRVDVYWCGNIIPRHNLPAYEVFRDVNPIKASAVTLDISSPGIVHWTNHGLLENQPVVFTTSGALPTGITAGTTYYVKTVDTDFFKISATPGGADINFTGSQNGNHVCTTGVRVTSITSPTSASYGDTTALNDTTYYYILRAHESAGNVPDINFCDSPSYKATPRAILTCNNYCLQSNDVSQSVWSKVNCGTITTASRQTSIAATIPTGVRVPATGNATISQTITGLSIGQTYTWSIMLSADDSLEVKISATSGANTGETTCNLKHYWQLFSVTLTAAATSCTITIGSSNSFTNGEVLYVSHSNFDFGTAPKADIATTTTAVTGRLISIFSRVLWDWKNRLVLYSIDNKSTTTVVPYSMFLVGYDTAPGSTITDDLVLVRGISQRRFDFTNNVDCIFTNFSHSTLEKTLSGYGSYVALALIVNCAGCEFTNWNLPNVGYACSRCANISAGCKDLLFANWNIPEYRGFSFDGSVSVGVPFYVSNDNSGLTFQNFYFGTKYDVPIIGQNGKDTYLKGIQGCNSSMSVSPGSNVSDSLSKAYTSVFDNMFYELYTSDTTGMLGIRFNDTEKTTGAAISYSGECGFDATGRFYIWGTNAVLTMTWPYQLRATTGFRNIDPEFYTLFWTSAVVADRISKPICLKVEYEINNNGVWKDLTGANLSAEDVSGGFYFKVRISVAGRTLEYDTESNGGFQVGDTITGATGGTTARVEEIYKSGAYGQLRLSNISGGTGTFVDNEYIQVGGVNHGRANIGTAYADNSFPNAGTYIDAIDIYTTVDKTIQYPLQIATVPISLDGLVTGSRVKIVRSSDGAEIYNDIVSGTTLSVNVTIEADMDIDIYVRKGSAAPFYQPLHASGTVTLEAGFSATLTQIPDTISASYPVDIASDWTVNTSAKTISHTSGSTIYTVNELYSFLCDYFDDTLTVALDPPMTASTSTIFQLVNGYTISDNDHEYLKGGAITEANGNTLWTNFYTLGSIYDGSQLYVYQNSNLVNSWWSSGHIDVLLKVKNSGSFIDSGFATVFDREPGYLYSHYKADLSDGGRVVIPLATSLDTNNQSATGTIATWNDITITEGNVSKDLGNGNGAQPYNVVIDGAGRTVKQVYEYLKYICSRGSVASISGKSADQYTRINDSYSEIVAAPFGTFAGGKFFGARGVWLENIAYTDTLNYSLTDANGVTQDPPVPPARVTLTSLISGSRVLVEKTDHTELYNQLVNDTGTYFDITLAENTPVNITIRKGSTAPYYQTYTAGNTINRYNGLSLSVSQIADSVATTYRTGIANDFSYDVNAKTLTHVSGSTVYTTRELYSWLADAYNSSGNMKYAMGMSAQTPAEFTLINSYTMDDTSHQFLKGGALTENEGQTLWSNLYTIGSINPSSQIYLYQSGTLIPSWWDSGHIDVLVKVKNSGSLLDGGNITVFDREFGYTYSHFKTDLSAGGRNAVPLATDTDTNNTTATGTVATWTDITITEGNVSKDLDNENGPQPYNVVIDGAGRTIQQIYEYLKYVCARGSANVIRGKSGDQYTRINDSYSEVASAPFGTFAGGKFFGARGVWVENIAAIDAINYSLIDANGVTQNPPIPPITLTITNFVNGSRVYIHDLTSDTELFNQVVNDTSCSVLYTYPGTDHDIEVIVTYVNGLTAKKAYRGQGVATVNGMSLRVSQEDNAVYNTNNVDGSTVTECSISGNVIRIYVDDPDNVTTAQRIYNWFQYYLYTENGIKDQSFTYISATDSTHYVFASGMKIINQDTSNPLNIVGANIVPVEGLATDIFDLTNGASIAINFNRVEGFAYSSGSGLSGEEHNKLFNVASDVWNEPSDSHNSADTMADIAKKTKSTAEDGIALIITK